MVHAKLNALSRRFYDVDSICRYIERGAYEHTLPGYKQQYVELISGPEAPHSRLLDRLDAIDIPETTRFHFLKLAARVTAGVNRLWYGRGSAPTSGASMGLRVTQSGFQDSAFTWMVSWS